MSPADWMILAVLILSVVTAATQGFFAEALNLAGLVVGYLVAAWQYEHVAAWFGSYLKSETLAEILGFFVVFFAVVLIFGIAGRVARWVMKEAGLSGFDRFLGGLLGLLKGGLIVSVILMGMTAFTPGSKLLANSQMAPYFLVVGRAAIWLAPSAMRSRFYQGLDLIHHAPQNVGVSPQARPK